MIIEGRSLFLRVIGLSFTAHIFLKIRLHARPVIRAYYLHTVRRHCIKKFCSGEIYSMRHIFLRVILRSCIGVLLFTLSSCKLRDGSPSTKTAETSSSIGTTQNLSGMNDLSTLPLFLRCSTQKTSPVRAELSIRQEDSTGRAQMTYRFSGETETTLNGRWDNFEEPSPYQFIYSFGELRLIVTNERLFESGLPATLLGPDAAGKNRELTLVCTRF